VFSKCIQARTQSGVEAKSCSDKIQSLSVKPQFIKFRKRHTQQSHNNTKPKHGGSNAKSKAAGSFSVVTCPSLTLQRYSTTWAPDEAINTSFASIVSTLVEVAQPDPKKSNACRVNYLSCVCESKFWWQ